MYNVYVHRTVGDVDKCRPSKTSEPIRPLHTLVVPVSPVHPLLKNSKSKDVWNSSFENRAAILAIGIGIPG